MAKITIELNTDERLDREIMLSVAETLLPPEREAGMSEDLGMGYGGNADEKSDPYAAMAAQAAEAPTRGRGRPKKTAAAPSAGTAPALSVSATDASTASQAATPGPQSSSPQPASGVAGDPFAASAPADPPVQEVTVQMIEDYCRPKMTTVPGFVQKAMAAFEAASGGTAKSPRTADPKYLPAMWEAIQKL